jgi:Acetyltransferase (GNAT) domain
MNTIPSPAPANTAPTQQPNSILTPTIFHEDWWLNAATNGGYEVAEVSLGDKVVGRLPYFRKKFYGMNWGALPTLTHFLGPAVDEGPGNINTRFIRHLEITRELIEKLPPASYTRIKCHHAVRDVIPFQEQKFKTTVQFTWEIHPQPKETLWENIRDKRRGAIRRGEKAVKVSQLDDPAAFIRFYAANLGTKGIQSNIDLPIATRIIEECLARQRGKILAATDIKTGAIHACVFYAWDSRAAYYIMTTRTPESSNGAIALLVWHAMQDASERQLIFDFDGLATPGSIMFYAGFGGTVEARYVATKMSIPVRVANAMREILNKGQFFY